MNGQSSSDACASRNARAGSGAGGDAGDASSDGASAVGTGAGMRFTVGNVLLPDSDLRSVKEEDDAEG